MFSQRRESRKLRDFDVRSVRLPEPLPSECRALESESKAIYRSKRDSNKESGLFPSGSKGETKDGPPSQAPKTGSLVSGISRAGREYGHLGFSPPNGGRS